MSEAERTKDEIREEIKAKRMALDDDEVTRKSRLIVWRAAGLVEQLRPKAVHCFSSITRLNEVETVDLFDYMWRTFPRMQTFTDLQVSGQWRIGELHRGAFSDTSYDLPQFDLIFVPTLVFDEKGDRMGYGIGYYDRFLASQPQARKVGLCFELGKVSHIPAEPHDVQLDMVITEDNVYS